ncbi:MAG: aromatic ring-hydroxylating dioxygenase subunit alpha [Pseudomonadota bacterium]
MDEPEDLFDPAHYRGTRRPLLEAETLPAWCYGGAAFYRRELARAFRPAWRFVGRAEELAEPGDHMSVWSAAGPVIVLRDDDGALRAFANSCRHRGAQLVESCGRAKRLVCPYHGWSYRLSGDLLAAPGMDGVVGFDKAAHGLMPLRLETWAGFVFVNPTDEGPSLAEWLGDLPARMACYRLEQMRCTRRVGFEVAANWKLLAENALEAYHTGLVHRDSLGQQAAEPVATHGNWTALLVLDERSVATLPGTAPALAPIPTLEGDALRGTTFTMVYPSTQFAFAQDCVWWFDVQPLGPRRTRLVLGSCFPEAATQQAGFDEAVEAYYRRWDLATPEDNAICERQQKGLDSALRTPGRFAASEFAVHALDNWVLDRVL